MIDRETLREWRNIVARIKLQDGTLAALYDMRINATMPQAVFRVGNEYASCVYLEEDNVWEVMLMRQVVQFDSYRDAVGFIKARERECHGDETRNVSKPVPVCERTGDASARSDTGRL